MHFFLWEILDPLVNFFLNVFIEFAEISCRAIKTKGMVFRYTWVYSKEDTMAHTHGAVVTS